MNKSLNIVVLGLSITSSWGNGHATTFRGLVRELSARRHRVLFLERDMPWYAKHRDLHSLPAAHIELYRSVNELKEKFARNISGADAVIIGSYVPDGVAVTQWVLSIVSGATIFYDIDTPVTLARLQRGETEYLAPELIPQFQLYLSFTGGPTLDYIERELGARLARPLYCSVDPKEYYPEPIEKKWDLGFLGTYSADRQAALEELLLQPALRWPAGRFAVAGSQYPPGIRWAENVERMEHLPPGEHRRFYNQQLFTLNLTRAEMIEAGYSPSVRLFEAAACGVPTISDEWEGLDEFFELGDELLVARDREDALRYVRDISRTEAREIGEAARQRVMSKHTAKHRAVELEGYLLDLLGNGLSREVEPAESSTKR
ncbi:MAG TPA: glycosyltransferase [Verrucomicrobiae bacterium]|nr:glycosyltransferase [Verrucomicrobiae bacterium]